MGFCYNEGCLKSANQRCSVCKVSTYCGPECFKQAWPTHKVECRMNRILREAEEKQAAAAAAAPEKKPTEDRCTGCNVEFVEDEYEANDQCPDCGYIACESCVCHTSRGSCYCQDSNFGRPYCRMSPRWYHMSSRTGKSYKGDRHPDEPERSEDGPEAYEKRPRACGNCGEVKFCMLKKYL